MQKFRFFVWILVSAVPLIARSHCSPIEVSVQEGRLVVSGGLADPLGYAPTLFLNASPDCGLEAAPPDRLLSDVPGFGIQSMAVNSGLTLTPILRTAPSDGSATRWLWYWDDATESVTVSPISNPLRIRSQRGFGELQLYQDDSIHGQSLTIAEPLAGDIGQHGHLLRFQFDNVTQQHPAGVYGFFAQLTSDEYASSEPFLLTLNAGVSSARVAEAARAINFAAGAGDFNGDTHFDCDDVNALVSEVVRGSHGPRFDLNGDQRVTLADVDLWRNQAGYVNLPSQLPYLPADINLDGNVDGADFNIWNVHKQTDASGWCFGDVNADGTIDEHDLEVWDQWKFTTSLQAAAPVTVPEPWGWSWVALGWAGLAGLGRLSVVDRTGAGGREKPRKTT